MSEERRRTRKKISILKGILQAIIGFAIILVILVIPVNPVIDKTDPSYILTVLCMCAVGLVFCYWSLGEFLSAYKDKDDLMD